MVGAVLLVVVLSIICLVIVTEKSFVSGVKTGGRRVYESAREDALARRERARLRRQEQEKRPGRRKNGNGKRKRRAGMRRRSCAWTGRYPASCRILRFPGPPGRREPRTRLSPPAESAGSGPARSLRTESRIRRGSAG